MLSRRSVQIILNPDRAVPFVDHSNVTEVTSTLKVTGLHPDPQSKTKCVLPLGRNVPKCYLSLSKNCFARLRGAMNIFMVKQPFLPHIK